MQIATRPAPRSAHCTPAVSEAVLRRDTTGFSSDYLATSYRHWRGPWRDRYAHCLEKTSSLLIRLNPNPPMNSPKYSQDPSPFSGSDESRSTVGSAAKQATAKVSAAASDAASRVKETAEKLVTEKKMGVADRVGAYGSAIHESARSLEEQDPNIAWLTHRAAERLEGVANYVRDRDFAGLREDAADLARRHPAAFFGGMCVAGLVLGSVIRAARSATKETGSQSSYATDESDYPGYMSEDREPVSSYGSTATPSATGIPEI